MEDQDKHAFSELMVGVGEIYSKEITRPLRAMYFEILKRFTIDQVTTAVMGHVSGTDKGASFFPKPGDIIRKLEGAELTPDALITAARLANTPIGCLARIQIGQFDLDTKDEFYLRRRAEDCMQLLPEWKARAVDGSYTDHEISVMLKYSVDPSAPFAFGIAGPGNSLQIQHRAEAISKTSRHQELIAPPPELVENLPAADKVLSELLSKAQVHIDSEQQSIQPSASKDEIAQAMADCEARKQARQESILGNFDGDDNG